jgi:hypothetical protein
MGSQLYKKELYKTKIDKKSRFSIKILKYNKQPHIAGHSTVFPEQRSQSQLPYSTKIYSIFFIL